MHALAPLSAACRLFASAWRIPRRSSTSAYARSASGIKITNATPMKTGCRLKLTTSPGCSRWNQGEGRLSSHPSMIAKKAR